MIESLRPFSSVRLLLAAVALPALAAACFSAAADDASSKGATPVGSNAPTGETGLPCAVQTVLADRCWSCHGVTPTQDAPTALTTYEALTTKGAGGKTQAELSLERMKNTGKPMPPSGVPSADAVAAFEAWIAAGTPRGTCGAVESVFDQPSQCKAGKSLVREGDDMAPGGACVDCHTKKNERKVLFTAAGTVFPFGHEADNCKGSNGLRVGMKVVITGADGAVIELPVNRVGNFSTMKAIKKPYRAKVVVGDQERIMETEQTNGDCNACHTAEGTTTTKGGDPAPGRIVEPPAAP